MKENTGWNCKRQRQASAWFMSHLANATHLQSKTPLTTESILKEYADVFRGEGKLEVDLHLEIDTNVAPVQLPTRKVPIAIKEELKQELDHLEGVN